jgi:hypothetical protein
VLWNDPATGVMRHGRCGLRDRDRLREAAGTRPADAALTASALRVRCRGKRRSAAARGKVSLICCKVRNSCDYRLGCAGVCYSRPVSHRSRRPWHFVLRARD